MRRTTVFGYNLARQSARRRLVIAVYAFLVVLLIAGWLLDHLRTTGYYVYCAGYLISYLVLGGYGSSGLIKPFTGKPPRTQPMPKSLIELELRYSGALGSPDPEEYRNDERELARRDRVHYQAYQGIIVLLAVIWFIAMWEQHPPQFLPAGLLPILLYLVVLPAILLAITLPQAILLWSEPDLDADPQEENAPATLHSGS